MIKILVLDNYTKTSKNPLQITLSSMKDENPPNLVENLFSSVYHCSISIFFTTVVNSI